MDFKTLVAGTTGLAGLAADALLIIVSGQAAPAGLPKALADVLAAAAAEGDFSLKAGSVFYAHKVAGVKAARVVFAAAGDDSVKGFRKALAAGLGSLKGGGARQVVVALAGAEAPGAAHGEALVMVASEAVYLYRHTKPSAPPASKLASISLLCSKESQSRGALNVGLQSAARPWQLVWPWRVNAPTCPGNRCTPTYLAEAWPRSPGQERTD